MVYMPYQDQNYDEDQPHILGGIVTPILGGGDILGPNGDDLRNKDYGDNYGMDGPDEKKPDVRQDLKVKPGGIYEIYYNVENPGQFERLEVIDQAKKRFKRVEQEYYLKRLNVDYDGQLITIKFKALKPPEEEKEGQNENASFFVGFTVAAVGFLLVDLLQEVRLNFIGGKELKKPAGGFFSSAGRKVGTVIGVGLVGYILYIGMSDNG